MSLNNKNYQKIQRAIAFIEENQVNQPDLASIANELNLSAYHFQKLFIRGVGISPKRFLQNLTIEEAKKKIKNSQNILDLSLDLGLSGPSRLHDLFVNLEGISPGEYKNLGFDLRIFYGIHDTPFGKALIATTKRGICNFFFVDDGVDAVNYLGQEWPKATIVEDFVGTEEVINKIFKPRGDLCSQPLGLWVKGTNFQVQVWRALLKIPYGCVATYKDIAVEINNPKAARAIGRALNNNPIALLIPCHRVIKKTGDLGGYRWGSDRKILLLAEESDENS